jgi:DNA-binding GntR family transcriptional regulator
MTPEETEQQGDAGEQAAKLENLTLWQRVHEHLRQEILDNRLPPGSELNEVALSRSLGVSRGPVREALGRLASEGLVTIRPRRGAVVTALSTQEFLAAYQVREALETLAIRLAVPRVGPDDLARLQALVDEMVVLADSSDVEAFFCANAAFHATFVEVSGNAMLQDAMSRLLGQMGRYQMRSVALRVRDLLADRVTLAADLISELQVGHSKLVLPAPVQYDYPFKRTIVPTSIPDIADDLVNGSFGFKFTTDNGFTLVTNALIPLNRGGIRANITFTTGLEFAF